APALGRGLPAEVPDPHAFEPEAADPVLVEGALRAVVENRLSMGEHPGGGDVVVEPPGLAGRDLAAADDEPGRIGPRQDDAELLDLRVAIDHDQQLGPV